jgi:hypothetical protein
MPYRYLRLSDYTMGFTAFQLLPEKADAISRLKLRKRPPVTDRTRQSCRVRVLCFKTSKPSPSKRRRTVDPPQDHTEATPSASRFDLAAGVPVLDYQEPNGHISEPLNMETAHVLGICMSDVY